MKSRHYVSITDIDALHCNEIPNTKYFGSKMHTLSDFL